MGLLPLDVHTVVVVLLPPPLLLSNVPALISLPMLALVFSEIWWHIFQPPLCGTSYVWHTGHGLSDFLSRDMNLCMANTLLLLSMERPMQEHFNGLVPVVDHH